MSCARRFKPLRHLSRLPGRPVVSSSWWPRGASAQRSLLSNRISAFTDGLSGPCLELQERLIIRASFFMSHGSSKERHRNTGRKCVFQRRCHFLSVKRTHFELLSRRSKDSVLFCMLFPVPACDTLHAFIPWLLRRKDSSRGPETSAQQKRQPLLSRSHQDRALMLR